MIEERVKLEELVGTGLDVRMCKCVSMNSELRPRVRCQDSKCKKKINVPDHP